MSAEGVQSHLLIGVMTDHEYSADHKRERITVWSGPWFGVFEAEGFSTKTGYVLTDYNGDKIRVECESPRTEDNYQAVDTAITTALREHFDRAARRTMHDTQNNATPNTEEAAS